MLQAIQAFLATPTPQAWIERALVEQDVLLVDHAHCEKKAASTALSLIYRYVDYPVLLNKMSRLAREELRHFEKVLALCKRRGVQYGHLSPARYADGLRKAVRTHEPARLVDLLIIGAFIEARSCERFAALAPHLDAELREFYEALVKAESRHYVDYLNLAKNISDEPIDDRVAYFAELEAELINTPDPAFRFHSGMPVEAVG